MDGETDPNGQGENPTEAVPRDITCVHAGSHGPARAIRHAAQATRSGRMDRACRRRGAVRRAADEAPDRRWLRGARLGVPGGLRGAQALPRRADRAADPRLRQQQEGPRGPGGLDRQGHAGGPGDPERGRVARGRGRGQGRRRPADRAAGARRQGRRRLRGGCRRGPAQEPPHPGQRQPGAARAPRRPAGAVGGVAGRLQEGPREGRVRRLPGRRSSSCSPSSARSRLRCCRSASGWRPSCSRGRRSTSSRRRCRCRSS